ncbi:hypothetical protein Poly24_25270 [Rosistilla carotiformis]|uniref:SGNH/GDSL hydrolase family protein n=1 Tax=Rosistilla carotiformis TaxID=2528017 RepID=A0A518JTE9_9BACT|nr:hypothetical protein [Rosistilla carotiformis]QDV68814.1 hypothetical protein Poly24_25270 [Rosistilla carotiformis]
MVSLNPKRRIGLSILAFAALVLAGDRMGARLLDRAVMSTQFRYSLLYRGELPGEIVALGNSRGLHMLHPPAVAEISGQPTVNLSFNALPVVAMPPLWHDYLQRHPAPKRLLFEISCVSREDEVGALERFTAYMFHSPLLSRTMAMHRPQEYRASQFSHLYRYNGEFTIRSLFYLRRNDQEWIMPNAATEPQIDRMLSYGPEPILYSPVHVDAARQILADSRAANVEVVLFVGPFHPRYLATIPELPAWIDWLRKELDAPIADYSAAFTENEAFSDHMHLNPRGARRLAELLRRDGHL